MKLKKKLLLASSIAMLVAPLTNAFAQDASSEWVARTVLEIKADLKQNEEDNTVYTIKYGDTLSAIAEAMNIDLEVLGNLNAITDLDLIYPDTILTTTYNKKQEAETLTIETPVQEDGNSVVAEVNLVDEEISVDNHVISYSIEELATVDKKVAERALITDKVSEWVTTPVTETTTVILQPVVETTSVQSEPKVETTTVTSVPVTETTVSEWIAPTTTSEVVNVTETPVVTETTQWVAPTTVAEDITTVAPTVTPETTIVTEEPTTQVVYDDPANVGLQPQTITFKNEVASMFGGILGYSLYRAGDPGDHGKGLAIDFMVADSSADGDAIAEYAVTQVASGRVNYVIWKQRIYGSWTGGQWQMMEDRGSRTQNHYDHVHVSMN